MVISCHSAFSSLSPPQEASLTTESKQLTTPLHCTFQFNYVHAMYNWKILIAGFDCFAIALSPPLLVNSKYTGSSVRAALFLLAHWGCPARRVVSGTREGHRGCWPIARSCAMPCDPTDCSPPGSPAHGIPQARIPDWVTTSFSRRSSQPREDPACNGRWILYHWATWEAQEEHSP